MTSSRHDEAIERISDSVSGIMWMLVSLILAGLIALVIYSMHKADEARMEACETYRNTSMIQEDMSMCQ